MRPTTSASNLFRRKLCPGSAKLEKGLPDQDSVQSKEGELLHSYMAHPEYDRALLRPFHRDLIKTNEHLIQQIFNRVVALCRGTRKEEVIMTRETELENDLISGTPDVIFGFPKHATALVNDSKFGYKIVERAEMNLQLRSYAVLVYDWLEPKPPENVFVSITQPRLSFDERITAAEYHPEDIAASKIEIKEILDGSANPKAKRFAGEEQCRYCKAQLICPEFRKMFGPLIKHQKGTGELSKTLREVTLAKRMAALSDSDLEKVLVALAFSNMVRSIAHEEARRRIGAGKLSNYKAGADYDEREIANVRRAFSLLEMADVISRDELFDVCSLPLGQIVERYRKKTDCTWKEAETKVEIILSEVIERIPRKGRIIRK